jgi:nifR3 family TIM-barrel protein
MAGYTDCAFRIGVRRLGGVGLAYTELLSPNSILRGSGRKRAALLATDPEDRPLGYQIYGTDPALLAAAAQWLEAHGAPLIDLNMGCPQRKIAGRGAGAGLLRTPEHAVALARAVVAAVRVPVTAKLRLGWDRQNLVAARLARELADAGVQAIAVHGRTGGQGYTGKADWPEIRKVVEAAPGVPVIGNGDVTSAAAAQRLLETTGCAAIMVGRGALANPWLLREIARSLDGLPDDTPPLRERVGQFALPHLERMLALYGEPNAVVLYRKWIVQYVRKIIPDREEFTRLLRVTDAAELRRSLEALLRP